MAETPPACDIPLYADTRLVAQSGRGLVLHLAGPVADRRIVHLGRATQAAYQCVRQSLQRRYGTVRLDKI